MTGILAGAAWMKGSHPLVQNHVGYRRTLRRAAENTLLQGSGKSRLILLVIPRSPGYRETDEKVYYQTYIVGHRCNVVSVGSDFFCIPDRAGSSPHDGVSECK